VPELKCQIALLLVHEIIAEEIQQIRFFSECVWRWYYKTTFFVLDFVHRMFLKGLKKTLKP
jgi:hypothetical protein